ncbi:MAG TPA: hypothetical protein PK513_05505 [Alphaproteobacteria bacterium]|nr:hypothetical protein [Alphaproteobacteria bacterium]USO05251.1 MAG: hypothetical protein H6859_08860 [Rhodospirillales bacterium]HOO81938.1 hypothetical protein [Alphaproteobacteria bacterium]
MSEITKYFYEGTYPVTKDSKNRVAMPKPLHDVFLQARDSDDYISSYKPGTNRILFLPRKLLTDLFNTQDLREISPHIRPFSTKSLGRFVLPKDQVLFLDISDSRELIMTGNHDYWSLYKQEVWMRHFENITNHPSNPGQSPKGLEPGDV